MSEQIDREIAQLIRSAKKVSVDQVMAQIDADLDDLIKQLEAEVGDSDDLLWRLFCRDEQHQL